MRRRIKIHREGYKILLVTGVALFIIILLAEALLPANFQWLKITIIGLSALVFLFTVSFFRHPSRSIPSAQKSIIAPADGKVVVLEEVEEPEYFKDKRLQLSIFMSPTNVHVNRNPISGEVKYTKYHPGKYLVAWHPKSSTLNERNTVVIGNDAADILIRQIAGKFAKKIVCYSKVGQDVEQGQELGFIKFGSRVDLYLPLGTEINVKLNQKVRGGETILGSLLS
jgi:phosphatidylserine decarboxylase